MFDTGEKLKNLRYDLLCLADSVTALRHELDCVKGVHYWVLSGTSYSTSGPPAPTVCKYCRIKPSTEKE